MAAPKYPRSMSRSADVMAIRSPSSAHAAGRRRGQASAGRGQAFIGGGFRGLRSMGVIVLLHRLLTLLPLAGSVIASAGGCLAKTLR